jgi:CRISPR/Cas system CSM-associated protein Csm3 (group 7 of RAMP superfamily)
MASPEIQLALRLELLTPMHVGTGYGLAGYLDARMATDEHGRPYVPGSSLKGRLRHYLRRAALQLGDDGRDDVSAEINIFGEEDRVGALFFSDCHLAAAWQNLNEQANADTPAGNPGSSPALRNPLLGDRRQSVMISRLRGVALEKHLFSTEVAPARLAFEGQIAGRLPDNGRTVRAAGITCPRDLALLVAACQMLTHLGGRKSRGLGSCRLVILPDGLLVDGTPVDPAHLWEALA